MTTPHIRMNSSSQSVGNQSRLSFDSADGQGVHIRHNTYDSTRAPFGLHIERSSTNTQTSNKAYLEVQGDIISGGEIKGAISTTSFGIENTSNTTGYGISLYGGPQTSVPTYGLTFTGGYTYGWCTDSWSTVSTTSSTANRGFIWAYSGIPFASIENTGNMMLNGVIGLGGDTTRYIGKSGTEGSWYFRSDNGKLWTFGARNTTWFHNDTTAGGFYYYKQITSASNITAYSDARVKENIEVIPDALSKISKLNGYTFDRIDKPEIGKQTGVIAQELQKVLPEAVVECNAETEGHLSVAYGNMAGLFIEAIKELEERVKYLETPWYKRLWRKLIEQ